MAEDKSKDDEIDEEESDEEESDEEASAGDEREDADERDDDGDDDDSGDGADDRGAANDADEGDADEGDADEGDADEGDADEGDADEGEAKGSIEPDDAATEASDADDADEEPASEPAPEPVAARAKASDADEDARPKKKKKKKKKKAAEADKRADGGKAKARPSAARSSAAAKPPEPKGDEDNTLMLGVGAVIVAILAVGVVYYMKNNRTDEAADADEVTVVDTPSDPANDPPAGDTPLEPPHPSMPRPEMQPAPPDVAAPPADAQRSESGLAWRVLRPGTGTEHPSARDRVTVHYTGWTTDGQMFDSSRTRGRPATFPLNGVIAGWTEGVQLMTAGEQRRFWIPANLAYEGRSGPQGTLVFDIELISFVATPPPPETPPDVAAPPANAHRTESGLAYRELSAGTGTEHPTATSRVTVHYTGWTTDGEMFDSSITRGQPATFPLNGVIAGWTEGVQLMVVGQKMRFWIPENLAYAGRPGAPQGMLVFDVELLEIH